MTLPIGSTISTMHSNCSNISSTMSSSGSISSTPATQLTAEMQPIKQCWVIATRSRCPKHREPLRSQQRWKMPFAASLTGATSSHLLVISVGSNSTSSSPVLFRHTAITAIQGSCQGQLQTPQSLLWGTRHTLVSRTSPLGKGLMSCQAESCVNSSCSSTTGKLLSGPFGLQVVSLLGGVLVHLLVIMGPTKGSHTRGSPTTPSTRAATPTGQVHPGVSAVHRFVLQQEVLGQHSHHRLVRSIRAHS